MCDKFLLFLIFNQILELLFQFYQVPKGHVWIEGDNKYNTKDSRKFGPIPYALLQGRVFCVVGKFIILLQNFRLQIAL